MKQLGKVRKIFCKIRYGKYTFIMIIGKSDKNGGTHHDVSVGHTQLTE